MNYGQLTALLPTALARPTTHDPAEKNLRRAARSLRVLRAYAIECCGGRDDDEEYDTSVGDLLADLMHLCDLLGLDFDSACAMAAVHHEAEVNGEL